MTDKKDQVLDIISDGLMNFADAIGDKSMVEAGAMTYGDTQDVFVEHIQTDNTCTFAFPSMVLLPGIRTECFVAVLNDKVIVAWRTGFFKKTTYSRVIAKNSIKEASWAISDRPDSRGASLLTITTDETIDIALPKDKPAVADAILAAVHAK